MPGWNCDSPAAKLNQALEGEGATCFENEPGNGKAVIREAAKAGRVQKAGRVLLLAVLAGAGRAAAAQKGDFLPRDSTVVFAGDSITDGGRARTGHDLNHTMGQDYAYILAAQLGARYPERNVSFVNRGNSGDRVKDLAARWQTDVLDLRPALLTILVGINDTLATGEKAESAAEFEAAYDTLLAGTLKALPQVRIILGMPFMLPVGRHQDTFPEESAQLKLRQDAVRRLAAKYHLPVVEYDRTFREAAKRVPPDRWVWDGIHPTYAGHALMAEAWLRTLAPSELSVNRLAP